MKQRLLRLLCSIGFHQWKVYRRWDKMKMTTYVCPTCGTMRHKVDNP